MIIERQSEASVAAHFDSFGLASQVAVCVAFEIATHTNRVELCERRRGHCAPLSIGSSPTLTLHMAMMTARDRVIRFEGKGICTWSELVPQS